MLFRIIIITSNILTISIRVNQKLNEQMFVSGAGELSREKTTGFLWPAQYRLDSDAPRIVSPWVIITRDRCKIIFKGIIRNEGAFVFYFLGSPISKIILSP